MNKSSKDKAGKILFVVPYPIHKAPSQRLKFEQYYRHFEEAGYSVHHRAFVSGKFWKIIYKKGNLPAKFFYTLAGYFRRFFLLFSLRRYDVLYIHLWVTPLGLPFFEFLYTLVGRRIIYDIDDLIFLSDSGSKANKMIAAFKGRQKPFYLMRRSDHVITCTPYLDGIARKFNAHTTDISSTINTDLYRPRQDYAVKEGKITLGWSGSHSTSKYLYLLKNVFLRLSEKGIPFKLLVMGDEKFHIDGIECEALPWKEEYEVAVISRFDIGLYPLPDEQWVYGKSGLKALQYMAAGIPTVATAIGTNFRIIEQGVNGFLAKTDDEWLDHLTRLIQEEALRKQIGQASAAFVEAGFSVNSTKDTYLAILRDVITGKDKKTI